MNISVSIVEGDPRVRAILSSLIGNSPGFCCVSHHGSAEDALNEIPQTKPQVVLMDTNLPGINSVECVRRLKPQLPETQIIMHTVYQNTERIFNALAAGATGYLLMRIPPDELLDAIKAVHAGGSPMDSQIARRIVQLFQQPLSNPTDEMGRLTTRESAILEQLAKGLLSQEIAELMDLSNATIHTHVQQIYIKLQVRSRTESVTRHPGCNHSLREGAVLRPRQPHPQICL